MIQVYRFFYSETEYQLMSFPSEDLLGVYTAHYGESLTDAMNDINHDVRERKLRTYTIEISEN